MEITTQNPQSDNKEKAPPGFILEASFFSDPKTLQLIDAHGPAAALQVLHIWAWLTNSADGHLDLASAKVLGRCLSLSSEDMTRLIQTSLSLGLLYSTNDGKLFHPRILKSREKFFVKRNNYVRAREKRESTKSGDVNPERIHPESSTAPININNTITNTNNKDVCIKEEGAGETKPRPIPPEPAPQTEFEEAAERYLEPTDSDKVRKSKIYITTGRRPCKNFPNVYLSRPEFVQMLEQFSAAGVVKAELKHLLNACEAKMLTAKGKGESPEMKSAFAWLTSFILEDYLRNRRARLDLKRSEAYLTNAEASRV